MAAYYNEIDAKCCNVLRRQVASGLLPDGLIDSRSIEEVQPDGVKDYDECHFFAGIGGFPAGFARAGVTGVNVWTGGFPCQNLSVAGKREGLAGERSGLWFEFHRLITAVYPEWVVIENVPGLFSSRKGRDFAVLLGGLTGIIPRVPAGGWGNAGAARGPIYSVAWRILDAQFSGLAQRRRRVFIVGHLGAERGRAAKVLFESSRSAWDSPPSREAGQRATDPVTTSPYGDNESQHRKLIVPSLPAHHPRYNGTDEGLVVAQCHGNNVGPMGTLREGNGGLTGGVPFIAFDRTHATTSGDIAGTLRACGAATPGVNDGKPDAQCVAFQPRYYTRDNKPGGAPSDTVDITNCHKAGDSAPCVAFDWQSGGDVRLNISETHTSALSSSQVPAVMRYGVRRLTPAEACRLQGFSDNWNAGGIDDQGATVAMSDSARYRQLGKAVAVPCAQWIGKRILGAL